KDDITVKRIIFLILSLALVMTLASCGKKPDTALPPLSGEITDLASDFVEKLNTGDFAGAVEFFDTATKKELPETKLKEVWQTIEQQAGAYQNEVNKKSEEIGEANMVVITAQFEQTYLDIRFTFNQNNRIIGLFFVPGQNPTAAYEAPAYGQPANFTESEVTVSSGKWELPGTLTIPNGAGPFAAVVLVHGSGPNDRDETIGTNGTSKPFKDLAWGLANQGIAVLRYDKRTKVHGQKMATQNNFTVQEESIDDAIIAVELLQQHEHISNDHIFVLGHSLGGMLAPRIGATAPKELAGLIMLAAAARPLEDLIVEQSHYLAAVDGTVTEQEAEYIRLIEEQVAQIKSENLSPSTPPAEILNVPPAYWLDLRDYKPAELATTLELPMLILQGERDYQVTMDDFSIWQDALSSRSDVQCKSYPNLNHLFITGDKPSVPAEYEQPGNVDKTVIDDIANWIKQR
ncbi:MAG: alpha/beta fold hydrolase, partial [Firmicutes bacterium]|nr:alpha/beta fold hydrolase [Bacillota bacterium]